MKKLLLSAVLLSIPALSGCAAYVYPSHGGHYRRVYHDDYYHHDHVRIEVSPPHHPSPPRPPRPPRPWRP